MYIYNFLSPTFYREFNKKKTRILNIEGSQKGLSIVSLQHHDYSAEH